MSLRLKGSGLHFLNWWGENKMVPSLFSICHNQLEVGSKSHQLLEFSSKWMREMWTTWRQPLLHKASIPLEPCFRFQINHSPEDTDTELLITRVQSYQMVKLLKRKLLLKAKDLSINVTHRLKYLLRTIQKKIIIKYW